MICEVTERIELPDGTTELRCVRCGECYIIPTQFAMNFLATCTASPDYKKALPRELTDEAMLAFLAEHGPATITQARDHFNCDRAGAMLKVLTINHRVEASTEKIDDATVFSVKTEKIDAVYPLGTGSVWSDNELRYSLRSLEKNFPDLGRVFIVGHKPAWLTGVVHVPYPDEIKNNKDANIIAKILSACRAGLSENFLFLSDDQVFLKKVKFADMVALHCGDLAGRAEDYWGGKWKRRLRDTRDYLAAAGLPTLHFDSHAPTPYNRDRLLAESENHPWRDRPMTVNTLFCNALRTPGRPQGKRKATLQNPLGTIDEVRRHLSAAEFLGYNDAGLSPALKDFFAAEFPDKSQFETEETEMTAAAPPDYAIPHDPASPMQDAETMKVWSFWEGPKPGYVELCQETLRRHCPDAQILDYAAFDKLWTIDRDVDFSHLCLAHQADWIRLNLLYTYGGIWLDADCVVMRPLDRFLNAVKCCWLMSHREHDGNIGGGFLGAPPQSYLITKVYRRATEIVRSKRQPKWRELLGINVDRVIAEHHQEGFFCVDWHQIMPLNWKNKRIRNRFWDRGTDAAHAADFADKAFTYMMIHQSMAAERKRHTREEILNGDFFVSYLFRRSLGAA